MAKKEKIDLKTPDVFHTTSDKVFHWIERHAQTVGLVVAAAVVLSLGWIGYGFIDARRESAAAEALFGPETALKKVETRVHDERAKQMTGVDAPGDRKKKPEPARAPDFQTDFAPVVEALEVQIKANANTRAGLVAAMSLSHVLIEEKQYARALAALDLVTYRPRSADIMSGFWYMHRGLALLETQKYAEAIQAYRAVLDTKSLDALHPEAMLKLGVAQDLAGDAAAARQTFEKLSREYPGTEASAAAGQSLRVLELQGKKG